MSQLNIKPELAAEGATTLISGASGLTEGLERLKKEIDNLRATGVAESQTVIAALAKSEECFNFLMVKAANMNEAGQKVKAVAENHTEFETNASSIYM